MKNLQIAHRDYHTYSRASRSFLLRAHIMIKTMIVKNFQKQVTIGNPPTQRCKVIYENFLFISVHPHESLSCFDNNRRAICENFLFV